MTDENDDGGGPRRAPQDALSVMRAGRRETLFRQLSWLIGLAAFLAAWWLGPAGTPESFWSVPSSWILLAITVAAAGVTLIRVLGLAAISGPAPSDPGVGQGRGRDAAASITPAGGTVICCSGGGIKSATFALGALQQLNRAGVYAEADAIVGVSGGGYMAGAFAAQSARKIGTQTPFEAGSSELATLRRRTDYLASSRRVTFDLLMSVLFGITVNALILVAVAVILAVGISDHAWWMGLVGASTVDDEWTVALTGPDAVRVLWPAIVLIGSSWCWFLAVRLRDRGGQLSPGDAESASCGEREMRGWVTNMPNALLRCGVLYLLLYPTAVALACVWHNWVRQASWWGAWQSVIAGLVAFLAFTWSVGSVWKGGGEPDSGKLVDQVRGFIRLRVAPWLGVTVAVVGGYALLVVLIEALMAAPDGSSWWLLAVAGVVLLSLRLLPNANMASLFPFYRDRLAWAFLHPAAVPGDQPGSRRGAPIALNELTAGPQLTLCATASVTDSGVVPVGRNGTAFILSTVGLGLTDENLPGNGCLVPALPVRPDSRSEPIGFPLRLQDAMAISGAAIAPLGGREDKRLGPYRLLLTLGNVRLGAWLRNPYWLAVPRPATGWRALVGRVNHRIDRASWLRVIDEAVRPASINSPYLYVHDGGHFDNLGLVEALRRKPSRIIVLDGTGDPDDQFSAMGDAIATARMDLGVEVDFKPGPLTRGDEKHPPKAWVMANAEKQDGSAPCSILYIKCLLPAGMSWDLESYRIRNRGFPSGSNKYEMYDEFDFEAYRHLGESVTRLALLDAADDPDWSDLLSGTGRNGAVRPEPVLMWEGTGR